jgi:hypothetical protein
VASLSKRYHASGALYDGRYGTRGGRPFAPDTGVRAVNNKRDVASAFEHDPRVIRHVPRDESLDPTWMDERSDARTRRAVGRISWAHLAPELTPAQIVEADRIMRAGKWTVSHSKSPEDRVLGFERETPEFEAAKQQALARRFRKLVATKGHDAAVRMIRDIVHAA